MLIGIDGSRAFLKQRTGIEEYSYQVIKHLRDKLNDSQARLASTSGFRESRRVVLYIKHNQKIDFELPQMWSVKKLWSPRLWTQIRLSLELLLNPVDVLFIPAHTVPIIHPKNTIVTIHGLEYEFVPAAYSSWAIFYMRTIIKNSCRWAKKIIAVSNNTKKDLCELYEFSEEKIEVVYEGYEKKFKVQSSKFKVNTKYQILNTKYLLFIGRLEERKNIVGIIKAFEILKEHYKIPHKLVLVGKFGYGEQKIIRELDRTNCANDIILPGYVSEEEKWELFKSADIFLFPTFYEGFGLPVLEAQSFGVPVVAGDNSSFPEITKINCHSGFDPESSHISLNNSLDSRYRGNDSSALLVNPNNAEQIADAVYKLISDEKLKNDIIKNGYENVKRFSWAKCADEVRRVILSGA